MAAPADKMPLWEQPDFVGLPGKAEDNGLRHWRVAGLNPVQSRKERREDGGKGLSDRAPACPFAWAARSVGYR